MCTSGSWIYNKYNNQRYFVKCGHCPACLQEKAFNRATRIRNTVKPGYVFLFVTLTYSNDFIPYIRKSDFLNDEKFEKRPVYKINSLGYEVLDYYSKELPVYRSSFVDKDHARKIPAHRFPHGILSDENILDFVPFELSNFPITALRPNITNELDSDKLAISYYPDLQNFIKRLRINLDRHYGIKESFKFFACSEYGPATCRPHFHTLIQCPTNLVQFFKTAIIESWPFCDSRRFSEENKGIQIARDASSYVSTYVNSSSYVSTFFRQKSIRPKWSYSKNFGVSIPDFSYSEIQKKVLQGNLHYNFGHNVDGIFVVDSFFIPKYVINRLFPYFKGRSRLDSTSFLHFLAYPENARHCALFYELGYNNDDFHLFEVRFKNKIKEYAHNLNIPFDIARFQYAELYLRVTSLYASEVNKMKYENVNDVLDLSQVFDNVLDFYTGEVSCDSLGTLVSSDFLRLTDPNTFSRNICSTSRLTDLYFSYDKFKKFSEKIGNHFS